MAIITFTAAQPGPKGDTGIPNDRDLNSMIMLIWAGGTPSIKAVDLYTNNFSTSDGVDSSSVANWNSMGYYEPSSTSAYYETPYTVNNTSILTRTSRQGIISRWVQDQNEQGHFEAAPQIITGAVVNLGGGKVGLPCNNNFTAGMFIEIRGTVNYNGTWTVDATTTGSQLVIVATYVAETVSIAQACQRITVGPGNQKPDIQTGLAVEFPTFTRNIKSITGSGYRYGEIRLDSAAPTSPVTGVYDVSLTNSVLSPSYTAATTSSGWVQVFNNGPTPRKYSASAWDSTGKNVWTFGGHRFDNSVNTNELWRYSTVSGQWTLMSTVGPAIRAWATLTYDPVGNNLIMYGGHGAYYYSDTWRYSIVSGTWTQLSPGGSTPPAGGCSQAGYAYVPASGTILCWGGNKSGTRMAELWEYTIATNYWRRITYAGGPAARWDHQVAFQTASGYLWVFGGSTGSEVGDLWRYDYNNNSWVQKSSATASMSRGTMFVDGDFMYIFGGNAANYTWNYHHIWRYDFGSDSWISGNGNSVTTYPYSLGSNWWLDNYCYLGWPSGAYDSTNRTYWFFASGDGNGSRYPGSIWKFDPVASTYVEQHPEPRRRWLGVYNSNNNKIYAGFGGNQWDSGYGQFDIWEYDCNKVDDTQLPPPNLWKKLYPPTIPGTGYRDLTQWVFSPNLNCIFVFSGRNASNDLWKYDFNQNNWIYIGPMGIWPVQRQEGLYAYDTDNDIMYIYCGYNGKTDWWKYDPIMNIYTQMPTPAVWGWSRQQGGLLYDSVNKCLWLVHGYNSGLWNANRSDIWKYDIASNLWTQMFYAGYQPAGSQLMSAAIDTFTQSIYIYGGSANNNYYRYDIKSNTMYLVTDPAITSGWNGYGYRDQTLSVFNSLTGDHYMLGGNNNATWTCNELWKYNWWKTTSVSGLVTTTTSGSGLNTGMWQSPVKLTAAWNGGGSSDLYHAISFNGTQTFSVLDVGSEVSLSAVNNLGSGLIGFPVSSHTLVPGDLIRSYGTLNYNYNYIVNAATSPTQIVVSGSYIPEAMTSTAKVKKVIGWRDITQNNSGVWQYRDSSNSWQNAPTNNPQNALLYAMTVSGNRMHSDDISSIRTNEFLLTGGFTSSTKDLEFGWGFQAASPYVPKFNGYTVGYNTKVADMTLVTERWVSSSVNPTSAMCLMKVQYTDSSVTLNTDIKAWVSTNDGANYDQISNLSIVKTDGKDIYLKGFNLALTQYSDNRIRFKITTHNSKYVTVSSIGLTLRY